MAKASSVSSATSSISALHQKVIDDEATLTEWRGGPSVLIIFPSPSLGDGPDISDYGRDVVRGAVSQSCFDEARD